jgi:hypothetical protein
MPIAFGLTDKFPRTVGSVEFDEPVYDGELNEIVGLVKSHYEQKGWNSGSKETEENATFHYVDALMDGHSEVGVLGVLVTSEPEINNARLEYDGVDIIDDTRIRNASVYGDMISGEVPNSYAQLFSKSIEAAYEEVVGED